VAGRLQRYARIKNEVIELLARGTLSFRQTRIALVVIRESWGWNAGRSNWTHHPLTVADIARRAGLVRTHTSQEIREMIRRNILQVKEQEMGTHYSFNEHENTWHKPDEATKKVQGRGPKQDGGYQKGTLGSTEKVRPPGPKRYYRQPSKSSGARGSRIVKKDLKESIKEKRSPSVIRDPENYDMTAQEADRAMQCSPEAREAAKYLWDEMKKRGAKGFPDGFFWQSVSTVEKMLKRATIDEIKRCITDLLDDGYTQVSNMLKVSDKLSSWQMAQTRGGWYKKAQTEEKPPAPPANEDELDRAWGGLPLGKA
jgi:phage replication O-like protein O